MLDINEINKEIQILENCDHTTYPLCEKLAILYTVRDHYNYNYNDNSTMSKMPSAGERML